MKYICLGYIEPNKFETMSKSEQKAMLDECFSYDDSVAGGRTAHFRLAEKHFQVPTAAMTLRWSNGARYRSRTVLTRRRKSNWAGFLRSKRVT